MAAQPDDRARPDDAAADAESLGEFRVFFADYMRQRPELERALYVSLPAEVCHVLWTSFADTWQAARGRLSR